MTIRPKGTSGRIRFFWNVQHHERHLQYEKLVESTKHGHSLGPTNYKEDKRNQALLRFGSVRSKQNTSKTKCDQIKVNYWTNSSSFGMWSITNGICRIKKWSSLEERMIIVAYPKGYKEDKDNQTLATWVVLCYL